jgi:hypothetical protein
MYKIIFDCSLFCTHFEKQERKAKELILRFSALLIILQGYALMALQMVVNTLGFGIVKQQK